MTKQKATARAAALGVTLDESTEPDGGSIWIDAPAGHRFASTGTHAIASVWTTGTKPEAWADIVADMADGLTPCPVGGDDDCHAYDCPNAPED